MDWRELLKLHSQGPLTTHLGQDGAGRLSVAERLVREGRATIEEAAQMLGTTPDIADSDATDAVFKRGIDAVVNFAAETHVGRSVYYGTKEFVHTNVLGVTTLLEAVRKYNVPRFVHISTDEVYGELALNDARSFTEESPFLPNVPYAAAKAGGDLMCRAYVESDKTPVIVTHCTNNFGPYQHPEK